ncbi:hypothetical protein DL765_001040 [Monosporascus sp. GIB2]|nr:hypothetical protein DL765_001040 [Monosporascus sp. GIB2]
MENPAGHAEEEREGERQAIKSPIYLTDLAEGDDDDEDIKRGRNKRQWSRFVGASEDGVPSTGAGRDHCEAPVEALLSGNQVAIEFRAADDDDAAAPEKKRVGIEGSEGARDYCPRNDPVGRVQFFDKRGLGDAANRLVHDSAVEEDCFAVDSKWAVELEVTGIWCGVRGCSRELPTALRMGHRVRQSLCQLARAMKEAPGYTGVNARKVLRRQHYKAAEKGLAVADRHYFSLMALVEEATAGRKSIPDLSNPPNASPELGRSWQSSLQRWPQSVSTAAGFANTLTTPVPLILPNANARVTGADTRASTNPEAGTAANKPSCGRDDEDDKGQDSITGTTAGRKEGKRRNVNVVYIETGYYVGLA